MATGTSSLPSDDRTKGEEAPSPATATGGAAGTLGRPWSNTNQGVGGGIANKDVELVEAKDQRVTSVSLSIGSDEGSRAAAGISQNETINPIVMQEPASVPTADLMARIIESEKKIEELRAIANRADERAAKAEQQLRDVQADAASANERAAKAEQELKDLRANITERFRSMEAAIALVTENA